MKVTTFLQRGIDQQINFVSNHYLSSHFIRQIYPHVWRDVRTQIVRCQKIDKKTFNTLMKYEIHMPSFCQIQPLILDITFLREWQDDMDWKAISRRDDLSIEILREFKDKLDWDTLKVWNRMHKLSPYFNDSKIKNEFKNDFGF